MRSGKMVISVFGTRIILRPSIAGVFGESRSRAFSAKTLRAFHSKTDVFRVFSRNPVKRFAISQFAPRSRTIDVSTIVLDFVTALQCIIPNVCVCVCNVLNIRKYC